ncbi:MAG: putative hydrolase [Acidimicrobiales bacterium]|nr:putative hydrolase [Acidimicrobiales bacterium]
MGEYVEVGGVKTWHEVTGDGDPLVLLHGGMSDGTTWSMQVPAFSERHRVYVPDRRGHGRTPDVDGPLTYDAMADDTVAFLEQVVGGPAHLVGWSDGGNVALLVSMRRPDLVRRQVLVGANFNHDGLMDAADLGDDPDAPHLGIFKAMFESASPDGPEHWPVFFAKTARMWREEPTLGVDDLRTVTTPTLVLVGDDEPIRLDHTVALYESLADSQLAVVPGASHLLLMEKPQLANDLVLSFLADTVPPATMFPVRRAELEVQ